MNFPRLTKTLFLPLFFISAALRFTGILIPLLLEPIHSWLYCSRNLSLSLFSNTFSFWNLPACRVHPMFAKIEVKLRYVSHGRYSFFAKIILPSGERIGVSLMLLSVLIEIDTVKFWLYPTISHSVGIGNNISYCIVNITDYHLSIVKLHQTRSTISKVEISNVHHRRYHTV